MEKIFPHSDKTVYNLGVECVREVLVNMLGQTAVEDTDVKGKTAFWLLRQATEKQILDLYFGREPNIRKKDQEIPDEWKQDFEDIIIINETMTSNKNWDYARMKQFVYDNCAFNAQYFQTIQMSDFDEEILELEDLDGIDLSEKEGVEVEDVIANMTREGLVEITEPESVTHGELPRKIRIPVRKIAYWMGSVGFILMVAGIFYNSKR